MAPEEFTQKIHELTSTPRTVLLLLLEGKTDDEIAAVITASPATVRKHVQNLADHFDLKREVAGLKRNRRKDLVALATPYKPALTNSQTPNYTEQEQISESVVREFMAQQVDNCIRMVKPLSSKAKTRSSNIEESTNQNQNLQPKKLEFYQAKNRLAFVLSGTIDEDDKAHLEVILPHLQKFSRDVTLTDRKIIDIFGQHRISINDADMRETSENSFDQTLERIDKMIVEIEISFDRFRDKLVEEKQRRKQIISLNFGQYIREDPEGKLRTFYLGGCPECNCQELAKRRLLKEPPDKWKDIAQDLNVSIATAASLWKRKCEPLIKEIALDLESD